MSCSYICLISLAFFPEASKSIKQCKFWLARFDRDRKGLTILILISGCGQGFCTCATVTYQFHSSGYATGSESKLLVSLLLCLPSTVFACYSSLLLQLRHVLRTSLPLISGRGINFARASRAECQNTLAPSPSKCLRRL